MYINNPYKFVNDIPDLNGWKRTTTENIPDYGENGKRNYRCFRKTFSNVIRRKQEWCFETWKSANESRGDRSGAGYEYPCTRQDQAV